MGILAIIKYKYNVESEHFVESFDSNLYSIQIV